MLKFVFSFILLAILPGCILASEIGGGGCQNHEAERRIAEAKANSAYLLDLRDSGMCEIPESIKELPHLEAIWMSRNDALIEIEANAFFGLSNLRVLEFGGSTKAEPASEEPWVCWEMPSKLESVDPHAFHGLWRLEKLLVPNHPLVDVWPVVPSDFIDEDGIITDLFTDNEEDGFEQCLAD